MKLTPVKTSLEKITIILFVLLLSPIAVAQNLIAIPKMMVFNQKLHRVVDSNNTQQTKNAYKEMAEKFAFNPRKSAGV